MDNQPEFYEVIPEFNSAGRLCNYHTGGEGETVRVPAEEWERFNALAGRRHEIVDGAAVYNEALEPCGPDAGAAAPGGELDPDMADFVRGLMEGCGYA